MHTSKYTVNKVVYSTYISVITFELITLPYQDVNKLQVHGPGHTAKVYRSPDNMCKQQVAMSSSQVKMSDTKACV